MFNEEKNIEKKLFKDTEFWRDKILNEKDKALNQFFLLTGKENSNIKLTFERIESSINVNQKTRQKKQLFKLIHEHLSI